MGPADFAGDARSLVCLGVENLGWVEPHPALFVALGVAFTASLPGQGAYLTWYKLPTGSQCLSVAPGESLSSVQT